MRCGLALLFLTGVILAQTPKPEPKGAIRGVVRDTAGSPVSGVSVTSPRVVFGPGVPANVAYAGMAWSSVTDEAGAYVLPDLPAGTYTVSVRRDRAALASRQIKLDADQDLTLDLVIPANPAISGRVLNQNQEPVLDAFVWLLKAEYHTGALRQIAIRPEVTHADGSYAFDTGLEANRTYLVLGPGCPANRPDESGPPGNRPACPPDAWEKRRGGSRPHQHRQRLGMTGRTPSIGPMPKK
ncbi:MAG TPA: carboxypeptidase-like regulatory domain-containing protein [Bryobacteraceae bacterium]|nr:carboxypeptidase-like regulatory domain-containing protein [Bryobacteraceae bacterium]